MLVDAGDVVVHLFEPEARAFYALERLWSEAEQLDLPSEPGSGVAEAAR
jgi:ribosome-associated protein